MSQKARVLSMLKAAGPRGVRSDTFLSAHIPRAAARVLELKAEGFDVSSEREKQFCRYRLESVGNGARPLSEKVSAMGPSLSSEVSAVSSPRPSMFDPDVPWGEAA